MSRQLIPADLEEYAVDYTTAESSVLAALNRETNMKVPQAVMLSGHLQGAFLAMVSHMVQPKRILEIGTYTGYSAICLAQGLQPGGILHTIEIDEELYDITHKYITQAGLSGKVIHHIGNAPDIIPTLNETFDLVFIDADKPNYEYYFHLVFNKLRIGGYILADNVLYEGDVLLPIEKQSKNARGISSFNKMIKEDSRIEHVLLPIRDGLMLVRKIQD